MTVTSLQQKWLLYFVFTLIPAYGVANWRHEANLTTIQDKLQREEALHLSTEKLIKNCALNAEKENSQFDASHQICEQGIKNHEQIAQQIEALNYEKMSNDSGRYQNFSICVVMLNLLGFLAFRFRRFFKA
jgi:hypothetical protein